ncbi:hypothetical protein ACKI2C_43060 [Streptomyces brasiliscabiei]|uniref:Uncharacterized protein n=1 Tax=Streptomyces brasiliscabiei TaxID=2736302 RepID=A0ABU8GDG7_9ACTN
MLRLIIAKDRILVVPQHQGETEGARPPRTPDVWPDGPGSIPRPSVVAVWKD